MIRLQGVSHKLVNGAPLFDDLTLDIPSDRRVAILGAAWSGKTTLIQMLAGLITPSSGRIQRFATLSFPAGYQRGFRLAYTSRQNVKFAAKIYGADPDEVYAFVRAVTGLGDELEHPMRALPPQARLRVGYALTYAIPFDTYLFDNTIGAIDPDFRALCQKLYAARTREAGAIVATRHPRAAEQLCDSVLVIRNRRLEYFEDMKAGIAAFRAEEDTNFPLPDNLDTDVSEESLLSLDEES